MSTSSILKDMVSIDYIKLTISHQFQFNIILKKYVYLKERLYYRSVSYYISYITCSFSKFYNIQFIMKSTVCVFLYRIHLILLLPSGEQTKWTLDDRCLFMSHSSKNKVLQYFQYLWQDIVHALVLCYTRSI